MTRTVPAGLAAALSQDAIEPYYAVEMSFDGGEVRLWTGYGPRTINGEEFTGAPIMQVSPSEETADLSALGAKVAISGISSTHISAALQEKYQGRRATIYFGEASTSEVVEVSSGFMDVMTIQDSGETSMIEMTIESKLVTLQRPNVRRYTQQSQQLKHPSDTFFDYVSALQDMEIRWGR